MLKYIRRRRTSLRLQPSSKTTHITQHSLSISSSSNGDENESRFLSLEVSLEATKLDNEILKEENDKMREKLADAEKNIQDKELKLNNLEGQVENRGNEIEAIRQELYLEKAKFSAQQRGLNEMKGFVKKLYSVAGVVLIALGGSVPPFHEIEEEDNNAQLETFCSDLHAKFNEWQGNHQLMHNELERTLKIVEDLAEQVDNVKPVVNCDTLAIEDVEEDGNQSYTGTPISSPPPNPSTSSSSSKHNSRSLPKQGLIPLNSFELTRRNPLRKCRLSINSYDENSACWEHLAEYTQFACEHCGDAFCRLAHVSSQLSQMQNKRSTLLQSELTKVKAVEPIKVKRKISRSRSESDIGGTPCKRFKPQLESDEIEQSEDKKTVKIDNRDPSVPRVRPQIIVVEPSGQEHKFAGYYMTILPQEQIKSLVEGSRPTKKRRYFCKCGKNYAGWTGLYHHLKIIGIGGANNFNCELCHKGFKIRPALKTHLKDDHKIDYLQGKFACLDCGKTFVGTMKEIVAHRKIFHSNNNEDEDGY